MIGQRWRARGGEEETQERCHSFSLEFSVGRMGGATEQEEFILSLVADLAHQPVRSSIFLESREALSSVILR